MSRGGWSPGWGRLHVEDTATEIPGKRGARGGKGASPQQAVDQVPGRAEEEEEIRRRVKSGRKKSKGRGVEQGQEGGEEE